MARYGLWPTPHGTGPDGHGSVLSQTARASTGLEVPEKSLSRAQRNRRIDWPTPTASDALGSRRATARQDDWTSNPGTTLLDAALIEEGVSAVPRKAKRNRRAESPTLTAKLDKAGADRLGRTRSSGGGGPDLLTAVHVDLGLIPDQEEELQPGLWPTPLAADASGSRGSKGKARPNEGGLLFAAKAAVDLWPTPVASEARQGYQHRHDGARGHTEGLTTRAVQAEGGRGGALNPEWVEWLMGFPVGWTDLTVEEPLVLEGEPWPADPHPGIPRIRAKVPGRKHRLKQIGNAVVPRVAEVQGRRLLDLLGTADE